MEKELKKKKTNWEEFKELNEDKFGHKRIKELKKAKKMEKNELKEQREKRF